MNDAPLKTPIGHFPMPQAIATDCDGTLLIQGQIQGVVLEAIKTLRAQSIPLILVTGRAAGFAWTLFETLGADAVIAENGGLVFERSHPERALAPILGKNLKGSASSVQLTEQHSLHFGGWERGKEIFGELKSTGRLPLNTKPTFDLAFRSTDFTFPVEGLDFQTLDEIGKFVRSRNADFVASTIHGHIMPKGQNKANCLVALLHHWNLSTFNTVTIGDSPNDEPLFDSNHFSATFGVANIARYEDLLHHKPRYRAQHSEGWGFAEIVFSLTQRPEIFAREFAAENGWLKIAFIDGNCGFCTRAYQWFKRFDQNHLWHVSPIDGRTQKLLFPNVSQIRGFESDSILTWTEHGLQAGPNAIIEILSSLGRVPRAFAMLFSLFPRKIQLSIYRMISKNRYFFGKTAIGQNCNINKDAHFLD